MNPRLTNSLGLACCVLAIVAASPARTLTNESGVVAEESGEFHPTSKDTSAGLSPTDERGPTKSRGRSRDLSLVTRLSKEAIQITVGGHVRAPGTYKSRPNARLLDLLSLAGGASPFGTTRRIQLIRGASVREYDIAKPAGMTVMLQDSDSIIVPEKMIFGN